MRTIALWEVCYRTNGYRVTMVTEKECLESSKKSSLIILGNILLISKVQTVCKNINSAKSFCVLDTSDINQTLLFELKVGCLSRHITLTKESIKG